MPPRILIVDDEPNILGTLAPILRDRGYEVFTAMSGGAALETVHRERLVSVKAPEREGLGHRQRAVDARNGRR